MNKIFFVFFVFFVFLLSSFIPIADARGADEPCNYLDMHHYLKISSNPWQCQKVDYWVPDKCGRFGELYKTDPECQPPKINVKNSDLTIDKRVDSSSIVQNSIPSGCKPISVDIPSSVRIGDELKMEILNPNTKICTYKVHLLDAQNRLKSSVSVFNGFTSLDTRNLKDGEYYIQVSSNVNGYKQNFPVSLTVPNSQEQNIQNEPTLIPILDLSKDGKNQPNNEFDIFLILFTIVVVIVVLAGVIFFKRKHQETKQKPEQKPEQKPDIENFKIFSDNSFSDYAISKISFNEIENQSYNSEYSVEYTKSDEESWTKVRIMQSLTSIQVEKGSRYNFRITKTSNNKITKSNLKTMYFTSKRLDKFQQKAVSCSFDKPIYVRAGPGSGKTTVLVERVKDLILNQNISPEKILCVTFNKRAKTNMISRLENDFDLKNEAKEFPAWYFNRDGEKKFESIRTWNSLGKEISNMNGKMFEEKNIERWVKSKMSELRLDISRNNVKNMVGAISSHKLELKTPSDVLRYIEKKSDKDSMKDYNDFYWIYRDYTKYLDENNLHDFADQLKFAYHLLKNSQEKRDYFANKFEHILVDEFQDNNFVQTELAKLLTKTNHITVVGDEDQTINTFQGAYIGNFNEFEKYYMLKDEQKIPILNNYRSTKNIVDTSNRFIHQIQRERKKILTENEIGDKVIIQPCDDDLIQINYIAEFIKKELGQPLLRRNGNISDMSFQDIAIITRINEHAESLEKILKKIYGFKTKNNFESNENAISVGTVHKSKGLEFPIVIVYNVVDGVFPLRFKDKKYKVPIVLRNYTTGKTDDEEHDDEERRIFYVAITRAINKLVITYALSSQSFPKQKPSPFIDEITGISFSATMTHDILKQ